MDIELPNGTILEDVPDDTPKELIAQKAISAGLATPDDFPELKSTDFDLGKTISNIPSSAKQYGANIVSAIAHPLQTLEGLDTLAMSGLANLFNVDDAEAKAPGQAFANMIGQRYGSVDNFKRTLMEDPVGVSADIAGIMQLGGGALGMSQRTAGIGNALQTAGNVIDPASLVARGGKAVVQGAVNIPGLKNVPEKVYQAATQFKDEAIMREALKRGINPAKHADDLVAQQRAVGKNIGDIVAQSDATIPAGKLVEGMDERRATLAQPGINATQELRGFDRFVDDLKRQLGLIEEETPSTIVDPSGNALVIRTQPTGVDLTPQDAQAFKTDAWKRLYGDRKRTPQDYSQRALRGAEQAKLQAAQNARSELEQLLGDEYKYANKEYGKLAGLIKEVAPIAKKIARTEEALATNATRFGTKSAAFGWAFGRPDIGAVGAAGGLLGNVFRSPTRRVDAAIAMKKARDLGLMDYLSPQLSVGGPMMSVLDEIERDRRRKLRDRLRR